MPASPPISPVTCTDRCDPLLLPPPTAPPSEGRPISPAEHPTNGWASSEELTPWPLRDATPILLADLTEMIQQDVDHIEQLLRQVIQSTEQVLQHQQVFKNLNRYRQALHLRARLHGLESLTQCTMRTLNRFKQALESDGMRNEDFSD